MKVKEVKKAVQHIKEIAENNETAHAKEDVLYFNVLSAIADGAKNPVSLAREAIKTSELNFTRWCG